MTIQFWFEFASTYSYPAAMRVEALAASQGIAVSWRVFLLGPIFREQGWNDSPFNLYPAKGRYMWRDLERTCERMRLPFKRPSVFPRNGLLASRIACRFSDAPWLPDFVRAIYRANFADDRDIAALSTVERCLDMAGQNPTEIISDAQLPASKEKLRAQTEEASRLGIFGRRPWSGSELFWGTTAEEASSWKHRDGVEPDRGKAG
jgi:2-hydroxychromene-2-carboxylate isomerase